MKKLIIIFILLLATNAIPQDSHNWRNIKWGISYLKLQELVPEEKITQIPDLDYNLFGVEFKAKYEIENYLIDSKKYLIQFLLLADSIEAIVINCVDDNRYVYDLNFRKLERLLVSKYGNYNMEENKTNKGSKVFARTWNKDDCIIELRYTEINIIDSFHLTISYINPNVTDKNKL